MQEYLRLYLLFRTPSSILRTTSALSATSAAWVMIITHSYSKIREEKIQDFQFIFKNFIRLHMKPGYVLKWALDAQIQQRYFMLLRPLTGCFFAFGRFNRFKFKEAAVPTVKAQGNVSRFLTITILQYFYIHSCIRSVITLFRFQA